MGGGRGTRLFPLVKLRCKPAVPLAGRYRLIDVPISNCLHSGINQIIVLTQFNSRSLNNHITNTYQFGPISRGRVEILAAAQSEEGDTWFQGTADAVRRCLPYSAVRTASHILILSGDQLYSMKFGNLLTTQEETHADVTIACKAVEQKEASRFGIMRTDQNHMITDFVEKPNNAEALAHVRSPDNTYWASMGIYLFEREVLEKLLQEVKGDDFGKDVIPHAVRGDYAVSAHSFDGYWEDIGTIKSFFKANLSLACPDAPINLFDPHWGIFTRPRFLPPAKIQQCVVESTLIADGCLVQAAVLDRCIIGIRTVIRSSTTIRESVVMGADYYVPDDGSSALPTMGIGRDVTIERAIVDKNVRIGDGVKIVNPEGKTQGSGPGWCRRDGIAVVEKNAVIPPGTVI